MNPLFVHTLLYAAGEKRSIYQAFVELDFEMIRILEFYSSVAI